MADVISGLSCPNCAGRLEVREGQRLVRCPYCEARSEVVGDRGARRYQVMRRVERATAEQVVRNFWTGSNKARDLSQQAKITELFLVYLPYWRALAQVAGWIFGEKKVGSGQNERWERREIKILDDMEWTGAAGDVAEFGVERVDLAGSSLAAYAPEALHTDGMVFEPAGSQTEAHDRAHRAWSNRALKTAGLDRVGQSFLRFWRDTLALVYYPLWVARYTYRQRAYQVVVDGASGKILYGKAPGNIYYRALMLVGGTALGAFVMVDGLALAFSLLGNSHGDDSLWLLAIPFLVGAALIGGGYRLFRWGEEVETRVKGEGGKSAASSDLSGEVVKVIEQLTDNL